ncbi:MAG: hypothetical protein CML24_06675 [Rhizobiales bacterium]|nr:hypothetical protein [Hyphomicrobiales bacterium]|tara:strand:+ start:674 stop:1114 length:441 start_codon:yes stop_codon:yes gene_type:complete
MSAGSSLGFIQEAVYSILTQDAALMNIITGVFDFVPDNKNFPYVQIGEFTTGPFQTYDRYGQEVTLTIHVYSQQIGPNAYQGMSEIQAIMNLVQGLLARTSFQVDGWGNIGCWGDFEQTLLESDGITRHGILRYRMLVLQDYTTDL